MSEPIVVAMSGGVDSSVAAYLLHKEGHPLIGVSMQVWDYRRNGGSKSRATCCSPADFNDARQVAGAIGIPYYVFDFEKSFDEAVIQKFVRQYEQGLTPNPCVDCNNRVKFAALRERAEKIGCSKLATGHYARVENNGRFRLKRAKDAQKDQTYFLYGLTQDVLAKTLFPLGNFTKPEVREIARAAGMKVAEKNESQDICFVSGSVSDFLVTLGATRKKGAIRSTTGELLGEHEGIQNFTIGQRRGLSIGGQEYPLYVTALDAAQNTVTVGPKEDLAVEGFTVSALSWTDPEFAAAAHGLNCLVQLRHRHQPVPIRISVEASQPNALTARFTANPGLVAPGQAAVFYDLENETVLGGGMIESSITSSRQL
jgi:tRNA-specific 2-thiouridylase